MESFMKTDALFALHSLSLQLFSKQYSHKVVVYIAHPLLETNHTMTSKASYDNHDLIKTIITVHILCINISSKKILQNSQIFQASGFVFGLPLFTNRK